MAFSCMMNWKEECDGCGGCMAVETAVQENER